MRTSPLRILAAALFLTTALAAAQTPREHNNEDQLRFTLILSRHGIRPPIASAKSLDEHSSEPWPAWDVPAGHLTHHGADALVRMGAYLRLDFARGGLLPATGCPAPDAIYLYSDTLERNISSTRNTFAGLAPNCAALPIHTIVPGAAAKDPLFDPVPHTFAPPPAAPALAALRAALAELDPKDPEAALSVRDNPELVTLAHILAPDPAHPAAKSILDEKVEIAANPKGDPIVSAHSPLASASSLISDIMLEYADGKPMSDVGWGRVDEPTLRRLIPLLGKAFGLSHRTPLFARAESSNMVAHLLDTLEQAYNTDLHPGNSIAGPRKIEPHAVAGAIGPPATRLVYISGHDTNLFGVGGVLGLHWTADGFTDQTPPDSQLVFELWQNRRTRVTTVRLLYRAQTLDQLRSASALTLTEPPIEVQLTPPGCEAHQPCSFARFDQAVRKDLNPSFVQPTLLPMQVVQP